MHLAAEHNGIRFRISVGLANVGLLLLRPELQLLLLLLLEWLPLRRSIGISVNKRIIT